ALASCTAARAHRARACGLVGPVVDLVATAAAATTEATAAAATEAATATAAASATTATAAASTATTAAATATAIIGLVDADRAAVQHGAVHLAHGVLGRLGVAHGDEPEAAGAPGVSIHHDLRLDDGAE